MKVKILLFSVVAFVFSGLSLMAASPEKIDGHERELEALFQQSVTVQDGMLQLDEQALTEMDGEIALLFTDIVAEVNLGVFQGERDAVTDADVLANRFPFPWPIPPSDCAHAS